MKQSGIYKITNKINGKIYIGSAVNFNMRKNCHLSDLRLNKHHSPKLQNAFNKHKEHNFKFEVLELVEDKTQLIIREQHYIDILKPKYNICKIAGSTLGLKQSKIAIINRTKTLNTIKVKNKIRKSLARTRALIGISNGKAIVQLDMKGNFIAEHKSIREAGKRNNIDEAQIGNVCCNRQISAHGFRFQYKSNYNQRIPLPLFKKKGTFKKGRIPWNKGLSKQAA